MEIKSHPIHNITIAELLSDSVFIESSEDALDILGNLYYQQFEHIIIHEHSLTPNFFDLKTGLAGEILQKFSNYRIRLAIVGDFSKYTSKSIKDFIYESNKGKHVAFVSTLDEAIQKLSN